MRNGSNSLAHLTLAFLGGTGVVLAGSAPSAYAQTPPAGTPSSSAITGIARNAFENPDIGAPSGSTIFTPVSPNNLFAEQLVAKIGDAEKQQQMRSFVTQIDQMVEKAYTDYGYSKNDVGVAFGGFLEACWEISNGSYKIGNGTNEDKAKTRAAIRQIQNALLAAPAYKSLPAKNKQLFYEACTFMIGQLSLQWQQAGSDATKKSAVQQTARDQLQSFFGVGAASLTRRPDGTFASTNSSARGTASSASIVANAAPHKAGSTAKTNEAKSAPIPVAAATSRPLPAASTHGAQFFIKYTFQATNTTFDQLILFPDGTAFTDIPSKPVAQFDEATLKASLKPYDIGTWKQSGNTLALNFPARKRDQVTTLHKVPRGWYDSPDGKIDTDDSYHTYFPVIPVKPSELTGAWHSQSLTTMGFAGGGAPMVAAGSSSDRVFKADGTFSGGKNSFASATTANMGDAFKSGGDVGVYGTNAKKDGGRWRLDGPLITLESGGNRIVTTAFVLPHWNKKGPPELLIDGDWWRRPEK